MTAIGELVPDSTSTTIRRELADRTSGTCDICGAGRGQPRATLQLRPGVASWIKTVCTSCARRHRARDKDTAA
jgi:hypothetical protein